MLEQAILDFIVSDLLLKAIPIIVLVVLVLEIVKTLAEKYDKKDTVKAFLPFISLVIGCVSPLLLDYVYADYAITTRIVYGGMVGMLTNGLYDQIKGIFKVKNLFNKGGGGDGNE